MPNLTNSLSTFITPNYIIDYFTNKKKGNSPVSYIFATVYNKTASSIIASEQRTNYAATLVAALDTTTYASFYSPTISVLSVRSGGTLLTWQTPSNQSGQQGISSGTISVTQVSASGLAIEYFWGQKLLSSSDSRYYELGIRNQITKIGENGSSFIVGNFIDTTTQAIDNATTNPTFLDTGLYLNSRNPRVSDSALKYTPYHRIHLKNGVNTDATTTPDITKDRKPKWDTSMETGFDTEYNTLRDRVIIGSSRSSVLGVQALSNVKVYNPSYGTTGTTTVPTGHTADGYSLLGPGALMMNGTFFIPYPNDVVVPNQLNTFGITNKAAITNRFWCYPGFNAPRGHVKMGSNGHIVAHVMILGTKR